MSLDRRLREGVDRLTAGVDPDVERHLRTSRRSGSRRILVRRAAAVVGGAAAVAILAVAGPRVLDMPREAPRPAGRPSPTPITAESVAGTYTVTVDSGPQAVDEFGLAGEWTFDLRVDGSMGITGPPGLAASVSLEGYRFEVRDGAFDTNVFVNDLCNEAQGLGAPTGFYRLDVVIGGDLVLDVRADACEARVEIFDGAILRASG
jgi:hypothetical protein